MIEVNLNPGSKGSKQRTARRKRGKIALPSFPSLFKFEKLDRMVAFMAGAWIIGPLLVGWLFFGARGRQAGLEIEIERAVQDSTRYARIIQANARLRARRDSIAEKLEIIQQVDAGRYIWPHVLDELSRALPDYTWLTALNQTRGGVLPEFQIEGRAGSTFALTRFMTDLESSPFVRGVRLNSTELTAEGGRMVYRFVLLATYEEPPPELVQTVPLFALEEE